MFTQQRGFKNIFLCLQIEVEVEEINKQDKWLKSLAILYVYGCV